MSSWDRAAVGLIVGGFTAIALGLVLMLLGIWGGDGRWCWTGVVAGIAGYCTLSVGAGIGQR